MRKVQKYSFILAGVFLLWVAAQAVVKPTQGKGRVVESFETIPLQIGEWSGIKGEFDKVSIEGLPHCALMTRDYENSQGYDSNVSIVYGVDLGDFHQPEVCMEGQGWRGITTETVTIKGKEPHDAITVTMTNGYQNIVMLYWFAEEGNTSTKIDTHKLRAFRQRMMKGNLKPSAMIRFITPIVDDEKIAKQLTIDLASVLSPYIDETLSKSPVFEDTGKFQLEE